MSPFSLLAGVVAALVLLGLATRRGELLALAIPLVSYLLVGLWRAPRGLHLRAIRRLSAVRVRSEQPVSVEVDVHNDGPALEEVIFQDELSDAPVSIEGATRGGASLAAGGSAKITYHLSAARGMIRLDGIRATVGDGFGLLQLETTIPAPGEVLALPPRTHLHRLAIRPFRTRIYAGPIPARVGGAGVTFFGLREYRHGDPYRWINWKASARHRSSLLINEFEQERVTDVGILLDARQHYYPLQEKGAGLFEQAIQAAASLAELFLNDGHRVSLLVFGWRQARVFPGYGKIQHERILRCLAGVQPGESIRLDCLPAQIFSARSQVIVISPLEEADLSMLVGLRGQGYEVCVVSPNPIEYGKRRLVEQPGAELAFRIAGLERALLFNQLRKAGVFIVDWPVEQPLDRAICQATGWKLAGRQAFHKLL